MIPWQCPPVWTVAAAYFLVGVTVVPLFGIGLVACGFRINVSKCTRTEWSQTESKEEV